MTLRKDTTKAKKQNLKNQSGAPKPGNVGKKSKTNAARNPKRSGCQATYAVRLPNGQVYLLALSGPRGRVSVVGLLNPAAENFDTMDQAMKQLALSQGSLEKSPSFCQLGHMERVEICNSFREICSVVYQETERILNKYSVALIAQANSRMKSRSKSGSTRPATATHSTGRNG